MGQPPMKCAVRGSVHEIEIRAAGVTVDLCGRTSGYVICDGNPVRIGFAPSLSGGHRRAEKATLEVGRQRIVQILHDQQI